MTDSGEMDDEEIARTFAAAMAAPEPDEEPFPAPARNGNEATPNRPEPAEQPSHDKARTRAASGEPRRKRGRPPKTASKTAQPAPAEGLYVKPVSEALSALAITGALAPIPPGPLATKIKIQAGLINQHRDNLAAVTDSAARHNDTIRKGVEALTMGSAGWILPAVIALAPFAAQSAGLWKTPVDDKMTEQAAAFEEYVRAELELGPGDAASPPV